MKKILFIAPHCFPVKSSESICNSKLAYTLAKAGYSVDVYTCSDKSTYPTDNYLDAMLRSPENLKVITVEGRTMQRRMNWIKLLRLLIHHVFIFIKTGYYYNGIDIPYQMVKAIKTNIKKQKRMLYDVVITRGFNTDYAALYMVKKYNLRWIANWNDPFPIEKFPAPYGKGYNAKLSIFQQNILNDIQKFASLHTFPCERLRNYMLLYLSSIAKNKTLVIHHMAHRDLLTPKPITRRQKITFVHCGSVTNPRNPENFLRALSIVNKNSPTKIESIFVGEYSSNIFQITKELGLEEYVKFEAPTSYLNSLKFIKSADFSLIIEAVCDEGIYLPTKFVDAMQSLTPVFCVSPKIGTLHDLLMQYHVGYHSDNTDVKDITEKLFNVITDFEKDMIPRIEEGIIPTFFNDYILRQYESIL